MTLKTAFWTTNTIRNSLKKKLTTLDPFSNSNTYQLSYKKIKKYRNQIGRNFKIRYNEHIQDTRTIKPPQSMHNIYWKWAIHIAPLHTLEIFHFAKNGPYINTLEKYINRALT
jgi:hypothetical protein